MISNRFFLEISLDVESHVAFIFEFYPQEKTRQDMTTGLYIVSREPYF